MTRNVYDRGQVSAILCLLPPIEYIIYICAMVHIPKLKDPALLIRIGTS